MNCPWCDYHNSPISRFCGDCGRSLSFEAFCPSCASPNPADHRHCDQCGTLLGDQAPVRSAPALPIMPVLAQEPAAPAAASARARLVFPALSPPAARAFLIAGVVVAGLGLLGLMSAEPPAGPSGVAVLGLALGAGLFAFGSLGKNERAERWPSAGVVNSVRWVYSGSFALVSALFGALVGLLLLLRLANGSEAGSDLRWWLIAGAGITAPLLMRARLPRGGATEAWGGHILVVLGLVGIFLALNARDLGDWYYSAIGDEYAFYNQAAGILDDGVSRPFSQSGVYARFPVLNSVYQAATMSFLGRDNVGWRLSSALAVAVTIPGVYLIGLALRGRKTALVAATLFAFSHYLFAYAHTGYTNIHALAPTVWAIAFFVLGVRRSSAPMLLAAGLVAGLGFYTYYAARAALPIMLIFTITLGGWRRFTDLWPVALGFVAAAAPLFVVSRGEVLSQMLGEVPGGYSSDVTGPFGERIISNLSKNLLAFGYNPDTFHYVSGPLLDPVSALLAVLGVGLALGRIRDPSFRLLLVWFAIALTATGILSPYPNVAISRLHFVVPPLALLAGCAANHVWDRALPFRGSVPLRNIGIAAALALAVAILGWNARQFWVQTPKVFHLTQEAVAIGALRSEACGGDPEAAIIVARETEPLLKPALTSYYPDRDLPALIDHGSLSAGQPIPGPSTRCIIFAHPTDPKARAVLGTLSQEYPDGKPLDFWDRADKAKVTVFALGEE